MKRRISPLKLERADAMWRGGFNTAEIARALSLDEAEVCRALGRLWV